MRWKLGVVLLLIVAGSIIFRLRQQPSAEPVSYYQLSLDSSLTEFKPAEPVLISELSFLLETFRIVKLKQWQGNTTSELPLKKDDFRPDFLVRLVNREVERELGITIPKELADLYLTPAAQQDVVNQIRHIRQEFLSFAQHKGVAQKYLSEINLTTLPDDGTRLFYYPNIKYPDIKSTNVHTYEQTRKNSQLQMDIYASNIYKVSLELEKSQLTTFEPKMLRDMALRYVVYHEMTHVLQHAFNVVNAPANARNDVLPWLYAPKSILDIDSKHYKKWGNDQMVRNGNNMEIAKESQAEGVAIAMLGEVYQLTPVQEQLLWEYHFGVLKEGTKAINQFFVEIEDSYPNLNPNTFAHLLPSGESIFIQLKERLDGYLASHVGYLNPMTKDETLLFWNYLRN